MQWKWFTAGSAAWRKKKKIHSGTHIEYSVGINAPSLITSPAVYTLEYSVTVECLAPSPSVWLLCSQWSSNSLVTVALGTGPGCRVEVWAPACQRLLSVSVIPTLPQGSGFSSTLETRAVYLCGCRSRCCSAISLPPPPLRHLVPRRTPVKWSIDCPWAHGA